MPAAKPRTNRLAFLRKRRPIQSARLQIRNDRDKIIAATEEARIEHDAAGRFAVDLEPDRCLLVPQIVDLRVAREAFDKSLKLGIRRGFGDRSFLREKSAVPGVLLEWPFIAVLEEGEREAEGGGRHEVVPPDVEVVAFQLQDDCPRLTAPRPLEVEPYVFVAVRMPSEIDTVSASNSSSLCGKRPPGCASCLE